ncbi:MAG: beta-galactosidase trimerization domain-containing protein, partial [Candidatus Theseobacter exili]|nr:beta-galactosidase trimerization domain-containing protein [Candidatus Theseobacter exili]
WIWNVRVCNWPAYGKGNEGCKENLKITPMEARKTAKSLKEMGINFVNTSFSFHFRFNFVDIFDQIKEMTKIIVDACHEYGIKVYEHHSSTIVTKSGIQYKRWNVDDWMNVDVRTGNATISDAYGKGTRWLCINNPGFKSAYFDYITDFIEYTGVDGLMHDDIQLSPGWFHCGCNYCRKKFKKIFGYELPIGKNLSVWENFNNSVWRDWIQFRIISTGDELVDISNAIGKDKTLFTCCSIGSINTLDAHDAGYTYESFARGANVLFMETNLITRNIPSCSRKYYYNWVKLVLEKKYYSGMSYQFNMPVIDLHYPENAEEDFFCWALTKSFGHNMWRDEKACYGGNKYKLIKDTSYDYFNWEAKNEKLYRYPRPYANIAVLFSSRNKILLGEDSNYYVNEWAGWCQALIENNIPFEVILDEALYDIANLNDYQLLILPNAVCLSAKQVETIEKFVKNGGDLILTHETSLRDETGKKLDNFGLSNLLGLNYQKTVTEVNLPFFIDPQKEESGLMNGLKGRFPYHASQVLVKPKDKGKNSIYYAWVERYNIYSYKIDYPAIVEIKDNNSKRGKILYFSSKVGLMNHTEGIYSYGGINYAGEKVKIKEDNSKKKAYWTFIRDSVPGQQKILWLDERLPNYKRLIINSVRYFIGKEIILETENVPVGIFINIFRLGRNSTDKERNKSDIAIHIVNAIGSKLSSGDIIPKIPDIVYPSLVDRLPKGKKIILKVLADNVKRGYLVSPDFTGQKKLDIIQKKKHCMIKLSPSLVNRYSVLYLERNND